MSYFFLAFPNAEKSSIEAIVRRKMNRYKKAIGKSVLVKYWDKNKQCVTHTSSYRDGIVINKELKKWNIAIDNVLHKINLEEITVTSNAEFWNAVSCEMTGKDFMLNKSLLSDYIEQIFIKRHIGVKSSTRIIKFKTFLFKIKEYEEHIGRQLTFGDINFAFYINFQEYMYGRKHSANYFGSLIRILKQVLFEASRVDNIKISADIQSSAFKAVTAPVDSVYLTIDELMKIHNTPIDGAFAEAMYPCATAAKSQGIINSYNIVKGRFLIGAFTGLRVSDFNKLGADNVVGDTIVLFTQKTGQKVIVPIHPVVREILDSGFDLSQSLSEQKTCMYIRHICKYVGINDLIEVRESEGSKVVKKQYQKWEKVSTHTARRSFATNAYKAGLPTLAIMKMTGHTTESSFMKYIRVNEEENAAIVAKHKFFTGV